ncbi:hypothetical protein EVAR_75581_1 [Eumeta japonica]|uniref:Reverse transcriptase domain-containing protein n=1 Tax=Eumeta variegata TaxID=151549 RepID=A0A4C1TFU5_EUMVA|nr:hypothetical protein EVAR_75581_1 [Eumeta japonica]
MPIEGGSRNLRPTPERRPRRTNTINTMKYDDNNSNSHTAFQPSNRSTINVKMICPLCNNEHGLPDCGEFVKLNMSEKWDAAKRLRMCFRCLRGVTCKPRAGKPCKICRGGHHRLLHQERTTRGIDEGPRTPDEGSTVTLIDEQVANRIGAKGRRETLRVSSVGGNEITDEKSRVIRVKIKGLFSRNLKLMTAQTIRNLKLAPQRVERATVACSHLTDIAENLIYDAAAPCILIGQDNWGLIVSRQIKSGRQPAASLTQLGWVASAESIYIRTLVVPASFRRHASAEEVRLVFDAAARTNGKCLNDALLTGPDLIRSLLGVLVRFRQGRVAVSADIKEMFLRVKIREEDRDSLRFLWRNNMNENPQEYRMTSLIFGAASSPCTAIYIKNRNASEFELEYPEACKAIRLDHYVDDFLKSFNSIEEAKRVSKQVYEIHRKAAFELRGWASNEIEVLNEMPDTRNDDNVQLRGRHTN